MMELINTCSQSEEPASAWRKSSFCGSAANCVEISALPDGIIAMRDSKNPGGPSLVLDSEQWTGFLRSVRAGEFDRRE
jgi:Domain of unknown function (DUF397)